METEARVAALAGLLLDKVEQAIGELEVQTASRKVKTKSGTTEETWEYRELLHTGIVDRAGLKLLTELLKELQAITGTGVQAGQEEGSGVILIPCRKEAEGR